jgi:hypothetical protein
MENKNTTPIEENVTTETVVDKAEPIIVNATIKETHLGFDKDKNIVLLLGFEGYGWTAPFGTSFGNEHIKPFMANFMEELFCVLSINEWHELKGLNVRVAIVENRIAKIGHIVRNAWLDFNELIEDILSNAKNDAPAPIEE